MTRTDECKTEAVSTDEFKTVSTGECKTVSTGECKTVSTDEHPGYKRSVEEGATIGMESVRDGEIK